MTLSNVILSQQKWFFIEAKTDMSLLIHSMPLQRLDICEIMRSKYKKLVFCCKLNFNSDPPEGHEEHYLDSYVLTSVWVWGGVKGSNSHSKSGVEHGPAEITGSARLAFGEMTAIWLCNTYQFPCANQLLPWKSSSSQRGEPFAQEFQISCYSSGT